MELKSRPRVGSESVPYGEKGDVLPSERSVCNDILVG